MKYPPSVICLISVFIALACGSCQDDPKQVETREAQKTEIARLKGDLALLETKIKDMPPDKSKDLEDAKEELKTQTADVADLEQKVATLEAEKRSLQGKLDAYKAKYPIP